MGQRQPYAALRPAARSNSARLLTRLQCSTGVLPVSLVQRADAEDVQRNGQLT